MQNQYVWIDAADFQDRGGWKFDSQFTHLMGSPYLLACQSPGVPVADAVYHGTWAGEQHVRVWVRTKNWYFPYEPGLFKIAVNGEECEPELGNAPSHDWYWHQAGDFLMEKGGFTLTLHDLTGYFGRCAAVLLTDDMDFVPRRPVADYIAQRASFKGVDLTPKELIGYDVVVAGAGPGGVPAAIAAARHGAKTLLVCSRPILGGNASDEAGVGFNGASSRQFNAREGGIPEEIVRGYFQTGAKSWTKVLEALCKKEKNLTVLYNQFVSGADAPDGHIRSVTLTDVLDNRLTVVPAKLFIDCTGDGWMGYFAGAKYRIGRESKWQYHEDFAPVNGDSNTMSGCIMNGNGHNHSKPFYVETDHEVPFEAPDWIPHFAPGDGYGRGVNRIAFEWWLEAPNNYDDIYDAEMTRDELFRILLGHFNYLKNLWDEKERAKKYIFNCMPYYNAKRESRRFVGDYVLTQNDCMAGRQFPDTVSHTGWAIDLHHLKGIYSGTEGPFFTNTHVPLVNVPFRCLYSANVDNLLFAGRCASISHISLGTCRLQNTIACEGQAVGTAAALCAKMGILPRDIYTDHLDAFRQILLRDDQHISGLMSTDPADLAGKALVTASSEKPGEEYYAHIGFETVGRELTCQRGAVVNRGVDKYVPSLWTKLTNRTDEEKTLLFHIQLRQDGYRAEGDLCTALVTLPPHSTDWYELKTDVETSILYFFVWTDRCPGVFWHTYEEAALSLCLAEREDESKPFRETYFVTHAIELSKPENKLAYCGAENVINGYSRAEDTEHYEWVSDPKEALPQWIMLRLPQKETINCVEVTLDTDMTNPAMLRLYEPYPHTLVKDYDLELLCGGEWKTVERVRDNWMRKLVHRFPAVEAEAVRVRVLDTGDHQTARIFEVRIYND